MLIQDHVPVSSIAGAPGSDHSAQTNRCSYHTVRDSTIPSREHAIQGMGIRGGPGQASSIATTQSVRGARRGVSPMSTVTTAGRERRDEGNRVQHDALDLVTIQRRYLP